jgi:hypothetical protein
MDTATLDPPAFLQLLKEAGISEAQAIAAGLQHIDTAHLATKEDILLLQTEIQQVRADIFRWLVPLLVGQVAVFAAIVGWLR